MADNTNKVTIDAAYFAELFRKANETDAICKECREDHTAEEFNALRKERDELKAKLDDARHMQAVANGNSTAFQKRLASAEGCIDEIENSVKLVREDCIEDHVTEIIRAWREQKEAK